MTWSQEISQLITDVDQLTSAANVKKSELDASVASTETDKIGAEASIVSATASFASAGANSTQAEAHKNVALAIYGTNAAQQAAVASTQASAALASGYAASASAALQQDLSGISTALHRSPNAIRSLFIYDTSKDSDGGAWTEKCQNTSWYNEPIMGKWLGPQPNENSARASNATLGPELLQNGSFTDTTNLVFTPLSNCTLSIVNGRLRVTRIATGFGGATVTLTGLTIGKLYRVQLDSFNGSLTAIHRVRKDIFSEGYYGNNQFVGNTFVSQGTTLIFELGPVEASASGFCEYDNISVREVISSNAVPGDYFQLTTDGKFYRLWKNLLSQSNTFTNAAWLTFSGGVTVSANTTETLDPFGSNTATKFSYITGSGAIRNQVSIPINGVTSVYIKGGQGNRFSVTTGPNFGDSVIINPIDGSVVTLGTNQTSAIMTPVGNGWYRLTIIKNTTGNFLYLGYANVAGTAGDYAYVCAAQVENGTVATTYEAKVTEGSTSEVFRGNKRDFPRLAGIVAEAANVTIYDLTEPGRPMWMRFSGAANMIISNVSILTVSALVAKLVVGGSAAVQIIDFMTDSAISIQTQATFKSRQNIAQRNQALGVDTVPFGAVIQNNTVNSVAMTVLPDAPIDPVTGLRAPTIAIATGSGVSIIKHDGTVVSGDGQGTNNITITPNIMTWFNTAFTTTRYILNPGKATSGFSVLTYTMGASDFNSSGNTQRDFTPKRNLRLRSLTTGSVIKLLNQNDINITRGLQSTITNTFNTGWMPGDIRRAYMSDTDVGSVTGPELITNGTFNTDTSSWIAGANSTVSIDNGRLKVSSNIATSSYAYQIISTIIGVRYYVRFTAFEATSTSNNGRVVIGTSQEGSQNAILLGVSDQTILGEFVATSTTTYVHLYQSTTTAGLFMLFDNISVRQAVADRSYKAQVANITGTLTKSQLASGTSLVGYSGFSGTNYLQEPYSADLDFGTGEWSASAWVNIPTVLPTANFPIVDVNLVTNGDFSSGTTNWASNNPAAVTIEVIDGRMKVIPLDTLSRWVWQSFPTVAGKTYELSLTYDSGTASSINFFSGSVLGSSNQYPNTVRTGAGTTKVFFVALSTTSWIGIGPSANNLGKEAFFDDIFVREALPVSIFNREYSSGTKISLGVNILGFITAEAFDGTTTRLVTTSTVYNTGQWLKAEVHYTTDGSLAIRVNGRESAVTRGNPLGNITLGKNLLSFSENLTNAIWSKTNTTSPTVTRIQETTATGLHFAVQGSAATGTVTFQAELKAAERSIAYLQLGTSNTAIGCRAIIDLSAGSIISYAVVGGAGYTIGSSSIVAVGDGWYRVSITTTTASGGFLNPYIGIGLDSATISYAGNELNGILARNTQLETGSSATSYAATNVAPLTIGNNFTLNAPFVGSIALLKLGTTVPTTEQSTFMYEQEKQLFRANAISVLPDTNPILDMSYDDVTDRWVAISTANESYWNGLVRSSVTPVSAGSYSRITTTSGIELAARITTNQGVDVTIPPYVLREELVKRSETANKLNRQTAIYDYVGGFTGNITTGSTAIASITNLTYPVSLVGARISGTGIPANATITAVSGTTIYISAAATATTTGLVISFLDFNLPVGFETESVTSAGVVKQEGATKDYTRLFDGFLETIRFAVAPGATTWVRIQVSKSIQ